MVDSILSNCPCLHNPPYGTVIHSYLQAYDDLFEHLQKINALTTVAQGLEVDRCGLVSEQLFWYFTMLNDHAMAANEARERMADLQKNLIRLHCNCRKPTTSKETIHEKSN